MELKLLSKEELTALYQNEMTADFPRAELKPLAAMLRLMDMGRYEPLLVTGGGRPSGYALAWLPENREGRCWSISACSGACETAGWGWPA